MFFLLPYSPEMNRIEDTWRNATSVGRRLKRETFALKRQELGGRVFKDEYNLALAVTNGIENRGQQRNYWIERLMFN